MTKHCCYCYGFFTQFSYPVPLCISLVFYSFPVDSFIRAVFCFTGKLWLVSPTNMEGSPIPPPPPPKICIVFQDFDVLSSPRRDESADGYGWNRPVSNVESTSGIVHPTYRGSFKSEVMMRHEAGNEQIQTDASSSQEAAKFPGQTKVLFPPLAWLLFLDSAPCRNSLMRQSLPALYYQKVTSSQVISRKLGLRIASLLAMYWWLLRDIQQGGWLLLLPVWACDSKGRTQIYPNSFCFNSITAIHYNYKIATQGD